MKSELTYMQHAECRGCAALLTFSYEEITGEKGWGFSNLSPKECLEKQFCGGCELSFPQKWLDWDTAMPAKPCPKPKNREELLTFLGYYC